MTIVHRRRRERKREMAVTTAVVELDFRLRSSVPQNFTTTRGVI
jgi:hypothetical protein